MTYRDTAFLSAEAYNGVVGLGTSGGRVCKFELVNIL